MRTKLGLPGGSSCYSYEDRIRAVRLYLKLGKRIGATIRQLGYPTKNFSKPGISNTSSATIFGRAMSVRGRGIPDEQKKVAVDHYLSNGRCAAATLRALGYPSRETLAALDRRTVSRN